METREFLQRVLPPDGVHLVAIKGRNFSHFGFTSFDGMAEFIAQHKGAGEEIYHACAAYKNMPSGEGARKKDNWLSAKAFWVDIDCGPDKAAKGQGYETQKDAALALADFCAKTNLPEPMVLSSGYGIHCYWTLTSAISPEKWILYAGKLKSLLTQHGVRQDPSRTADFASILRPVGTTNNKHKTPKVVKCKLEGKDIENDVFFASLDKLVPTDPLANKPDWLTDSDNINSVFEHLQPETLYRADTIAERCAVVRHVRDTKGDATYETWRKVIGLLTFCENGEELAREWTAGRAAAGHSQTNWKTKYNTWDAPPPRCDGFRGENPELCKGCPHNVTTPLILGRELEEQKPIEIVRIDTGAKETWTPPIPPGYQWDAKHNMLFAVVKKKGAEPELLPFCPTLFYPVGRLCNQDAKFSLPIRMHLPDGATRDFDLPSGCIGQGGALLMKELAEHEIYATTFKGAESAMASYLKDQAERMKKTAQVTRAFTRFGWQDKETSFLIGNRLYQSDGSVTEVALRGYAQARQNMYPEPRGTLEGYAKAINWIYSRPGMEPMQYAIASLWAAPLSPLVDAMYKGIPCALTGAASGKGKTTAFTAALYAYGDGSAGMTTVTSKTGSTTKAKLALMGTVANLPILFDEFTNITPKEMSDMAYSLANGSDVLRLRAGKGDGVTFADSATWNTQTGLTGNTNLISLLGIKGQSEAEAMRVFEIRIDNYDIPMLNPLEVAAKLNSMSQNVGQAGDVFIKYVVTHQAEVQKLMAKVKREVSQDSAIAREPKYRFYLYHMICTLTGAMIMKELGVCSFDMDRLFEFARNTVLELCDEVMEVNDTAPEETLSQYIIDNLNGTLITSTLMQANVPYPPRGEIVSRAIVSRSEEDSRDCWNGKYFTSLAAFKAWCTFNRVDPKVLLKDLKKKGILVYQGQKVCLTKGTNLPQVRLRGHLFDIKSLDMDLGEPQDGGRNEI